MKKFLFVLTAAAVLGSGIAPRAEVIEQVLVKVNGDILTKTELESRQVQVLRTPRARRSSRSTGFRRA